MIKRLYEQFQPENYKLMLDINSEDSLFSGSVAISGKSIKQKNNIELHSKDLEITSAKIGDEDAKVSVGIDDTLTIELGHEVKPGEVTVEIEFSGKITDAMHGMYPCYFEHEGKKKKLIATQFESHHAREVFPCIDEPAAKATFDLELTTAQGEVVLANTPSKKSSNVNRRTTSTFETTPKMSTYLVAFVTGEMHSKEAVTKDGVIVKSWATVAQDKNLLDYSVKETVALLEFYNDYFNTPYPLPKCDQVALPDFEVGAMENWGLIVYRETAFLSDPVNVSLSTQQLVSEVIAHELSHQWFGNLVTMQWWDDLWLNESFANMTEFMAVDKLHPEWKIWEEFAAQDALSATNRDVYTDVQAVRVEVANPETIHTLFDPSIVYAKGGKLLKTLHTLLGDDVWRAGLKKYFTKHAYGNTTMDDLWAALENVSDYPVSQIMNKWITSPGQPLIEVNQNKDIAQISQRRLLLDQTDPESSWIVPLIANHDVDLLKESSAQFNLKSDDWLLLNTSGTGHFVVDYKNPEHKKWVEEQISSDDALSTWKITHLNALVMLAKNGTTSLVEALDTVKFTSGEKRAAVWSQISGVIANARMLTEGDESAEKTLKAFTYDLIKKTYSTLGWDYQESEDSNTTHMRTTAIALAVGSENEQVIKDALVVYGKSSKLVDLPAELRSLLMGVSVRFGKKETFNELLTLFKSSQNAELKSDICAALCSSRDEEQLKQLLGFLTYTKLIRTQDTIRWYAYIMRNKYGRKLAWKWLKTNWNWVVETFGGSKSYDDFARYSAAFMNSSEWLKEYKEFFEPMVNNPSLKRTIQIGVKEVQARADWREKDEPKITEWLKSDHKVN